MAENIIDIIIPNQGLTVTEVVIEKWHKQEGDTLQKGDPLLDFESDKAVIEMEAPQDGVLVKIVAAAGETVAIGGIVARITIS